LGILPVSVAFLPLLVSRPFEFVDRIWRIALRASNNEVSIRFDHYQFFGEADGSEAKKRTAISGTGAAKIPGSAAGRNRVRTISSSEIVI